MLSLPHARWKRAGADAAGRAVEHGTGSCVNAALVPALYTARETTTFAYAGYVDIFAGLKAVNQNAIANFCFFVRGFQPNLAQQTHGRPIRFFELASHCFVHAL